MKLNVILIVRVVALAVAGGFTSPARAQELMMGPDGAIHLDGQGVAAGQPILITNSPEIIHTPGAQPWMGGQPMMSPAYGAYAPQCMSCAPAVNAPNPNLGPCRRMMNAGLQWVVGVEFLYARASFSDAAAYVTTDSDAQALSFTPLDFDYEPSYSVYGGAFVSQWGGAMIIDFTRLSSDASFGAVTSGSSTVVAPFLEADVNGSANVDAKTYDLSFSKSLYLGGEAPAASGAAAAGCPTCVAVRPPWEPAWELGFEGGIRFADVDWSRSAMGFAPGDPTVAVGSSRGELSFDGFGPRLGLLGRRYLGKRGVVSVYAKGDWSLVWGDVDLSFTETLADTATTTIVRSGGNRMVPVTELELGATTNIGQSASFSAGYFWMAWHDLGTSDNLSPITLSGGSGGNILGFDGLFVRGEVAY